MKKTMYKILNKDLTSHFQGFQYEIGAECHCEDFDNDQSTDCSNGFYATGVEGLLYTNLAKGRKVFEVEVWGQEVLHPPYKNRYEYQKIIREVPLSEVKALVFEQNKKMGWNFYNTLFPINPLELPKVTKVTEQDVELLKEWASVSDSGSDSGSDSVVDLVWDLVVDSVGEEVGDAVYGSVCNAVYGAVCNAVYGSVPVSVGDSVRASVYAYSTSLFPNIEFEYDFSSCIKLCNKGLVPSYDGTSWRLHSGKNADIIWEGKL